MYFLHQIKHTNGTYDKGLVVKETMDAAEQSYHAYLGAYGFGQQPDTDFVACSITDDNGMLLMDRSWKKQVSESEPEPEVETA